ncbi:hypothetical protein GKQ77_04990 [Streptomyces sp. BG9H]|uniref:Lipoprotein n=1 Tax=Streptomyces anatolicus TaxID=2675858 RepID=A0ABS6YK46_9ACTN|nr:hypothetical protein [Streptomyces anatolicus]MBW5420927.1 hypothetical protein [Streptomyces anatolicus]
MGILAATLTSCGSDPDRRCVDRDSYDGFLGYRIIGDKSCKTFTGTSHGKGRKASNGSYGTGRTPDRTTDPAWYYDAEITGRHADNGTFSRSEAVDRDGFGCSSGSGGNGGSRSGGG